MAEKNRLDEALSLRGMKQIELSEKTGLNKTSINGWKSHRWEPKADALHKMAKALDVSELWLAGYDVPMDRPEEQKTADVLADLTREIKKDPQLRRIVTLTSKLTESQKDIIEKMLLEMAKN